MLTPAKAVKAVKIKTKAKWRLQMFRNLVIINKITEIENIVYINFMIKIWISCSYLAMIRLLRRVLKVKLRKLI